MTRRFALLLVALSITAAGLNAGQDPPKSPTESEATAPLAFEVTSVKPTNTPPVPGEFGGIRALPGGQTYVARFVP